VFLWEKVADLFDTLVDNPKDRSSIFGVA